MWLLSYVGANFSFIIAGTAALAALVAFAWFTRNWKAALAAAVLLSLGFVAMAIDRNGFQRAVNAQKARELRILQDRIGALVTIGTADAKRAEAAEATIKALRKQAMQTPANNTPCLDADSAERVGNIK